VSYQDQIKKHLVEYKLKYLGISEPGIFRCQRGDEFRDHVLPRSYADRNLLEEAAPPAREFFREHHNKRHRYFHHLNSSQAFAFNLFFPYFDGGLAAASALLRALGQGGVLVEWKPEAGPEPDEGSNIDVLWTTGDGVQTFCEVKLSEADFGKAANDARHRDKFHDTYRGVLAAHLEPRRLEYLAFFDAYQFNRNVWHMVSADRNRLIFLLPRANAVLRALLEELLKGVAARTRERISPVFIEDVVAKLSVDDRCPRGLREYAIKLKHKYVIQTSA
jgi:hypothetical protein